jgi:hypothetical protein
MKPTINDAVRTVGHLLKHHGTVAAFARYKDGTRLEDVLGPADGKNPDFTGASSFCMVGAIQFVTQELLKAPIGVMNDVFDVVVKTTGYSKYGQDGNWTDCWDRSSTLQRLHMTTALCNLQDP